MRAIAIIPARGGSKRLPRKNLYPLRGLPLIAYAIRAARESRYVDQVYVSSEDTEILAAARRFDALPLERPAELAGDIVPKMEVIRHAVAHLRASGGPLADLVLVPQANSPQLRAADIDRGFELLLKFNLWEVMSADQHGVQNAAFRIIRTEHVFNTFLSAHCGFVVTDTVDVHTVDDIRAVEDQM